jgi:hypothetical protein
VDGGRLNWGYAECKEGRSDAGRRSGSSLPHSGHGRVGTRWSRSSSQMVTVSAQVLLVGAQNVFCVLERGRSVEAWMRGIFDQFSASMALIHVRVVGSALYVFDFVPQSQRPNERSPATELLFENFHEFVRVEKRVVRVVDRLIPILVTLTEGGI